MEAFSPISNALLFIAYLALWVSYLRVFLLDRPPVVAWSRRLLYFTLALHVVVLIWRTEELGRAPMGSPLEFFSLQALALATIYAVIERRVHVRQTGFVVIGLAMLLQLFSSAFVGRGAQPNPWLSNTGFVVHVLLMLFAYTALSVGFLYALLYLFQARQLTKRTFGLFFQRMPALEILERMSVGAVKLGVVILLPALIQGHFLLGALKARLEPDAAARLSHLDPKIVASWILFLAYGIGLLGHRFFDWRGRRMNRVAIAGFVFMVIAMAVIHHFFPSFHNFSTHGEA